MPKPTKKPTKKHTAKTPRAVKATNDVEAYGNRFLDCTPATKEALAFVADALAISIPTTLARLLLTCGGGRPEKGYFLGDEYEVEVGRLLAVRVPEGSKRESLELARPRLVARSGLPTSLVPFALDTGNANFFCVDLATHEVVYFLLDEPGRAPKRIAPSLELFLEGLDSPPY